MCFIFKLIRAMCPINYGNYWWVIQAPTYSTLVTPLFFVKIKFEEF
jgi:hypothetical protein